eukprot:scpid103427/ scgid11433/ 
MVCTGFFLPHSLLRVIFGMTDIRARSCIETKLNNIVVFQVVFCPESEASLSNIFRATGIYGRCISFYTTTCTICLICHHFFDFHPLSRCVRASCTCFVKNKNKKVHCFERM